MRKNVLILVCAVVLFSLFNTTKTNFMFWNNPEINNDYIIFPDIPISYDNDISLFGLFINFFSDLDLDYTINITPTIDEEITNIITNQKGTYFIQFAASESPVKSFKGIDCSLLSKYKLRTSFDSNIQTIPRLPLY